jgi:hypothetical protein
MQQVATCVIFTRLLYLEASGDRGFLTFWRYPHFLLTFYEIAVGLPFLMKMDLAPLQLRE